MIDRSRVSRGLLAAVTVACTALFASGASATTFGVTVPADAPVVGAPTASGATALAFPLNDRLCMVALEHGAPRPTKLDREDAEGGDCVKLPILEPLGRTIVSYESSIDDARLTATGVTGTDVAAVEWRAAGRTVARADTVVSPLPGAAADLRFFVLEVARDAQKGIDELALLDASGAVRRAFDPSQPLDEGTSFGPSRAPATTTIRRGHHGKHAWQLETHVSRPLAPTPLEPERRALLACVTLRGGPGGRTLCDDEGARGAPFLSSAGPECGPLGNTVEVVARPAVRRVVAILGDGRRRTIALDAVPGVPGMRAGVAVLGTGIAIRRLAAIGADGRTLSSEPIGLQPVPPGQTDRDGSCSSGGALLTYAAGLPQEQLSAGPHTPVLADAGPRLCLAVDRAPRPPQACWIPPVEASAAGLGTVPTADGRYVVGLVPTTVASATLVLDDKTTRDVASAELPGYSGQYATTVRLVAAGVPGVHRVVGYQLRDARGRILSSVDFGPELPAPGPATTLLRPAGLPPIRARLFPPGGERAPLLCLSAGRLTGPPNSFGCQFAETGSFIATATCSPRRIVLLGLLRRATDRLSVQTASGREVRAQVAALPPHLRRGAAAAAVVVLPATAAPRMVILRGGKSGHAELVLPPARAQCGYTAYAEPGSEQL